MNEAAEKTLVVYFSRKGYTEKTAVQTAKSMKADILRLETGERTSGIPGFWWCGRFGMLRTGMELAPYETDVSVYDRVIICSPIWVFTLCAPVRQFLINESGKIKKSEYIFVHFSSPMHYRSTAECADRLLGIKRDSYESIMCMWGHFFRRKRFK